MQWNDSGKKAFDRGDTLLPRGTRVKFGPDGKLAAAGVGDRDLGVLHQDQVSHESLCTVIQPNKPGTVVAIAKTSINVGATVYTAADGKVSGTQASGAYVRGIAMTASTADGDFIEIYNELGETPKA